MERVNLYDQIERNKLKSILLLVVFIAIVLLMGWVFGELAGIGSLGLVIAIAIALIMSFYSYYHSDSLVIKASGAQPADEKHYRFLHNTVEGLTIAAGIPKPRVYVIESDAINAFATGRDPQHAVVAVTIGALRKLERQELEGVLAHELAHVRNYDIRYMAMVAVLVGVVALLSGWMLRMTLWGRRDRGGGSRVELYLFLLGLVLATLTPFIAELIKLAVSRKREYLADADGAMLNRNPAGLASALKKIAAEAKPTENATNATAHLYFANPFKPSFWSNLFSTHPPIEERIRLLEGMA